MDSNQLYCQFCRACYFGTGGWLPMTPLHAKLELGDFGQIREGQFKPLGNIRKFPLAHPIKISDSIALNVWDWQLESDAERTASGIQLPTDDPETAQVWRTQGFVFNRQGGFVFHGAEPEARLILNWSEFCPEVTVKLAFSDYSFREVCVVTAIATLDQWGFAVAGRDGAHLEVAAQMKENDCGLLGHESSKLLQSRHIACLEKANGRPAHFFKAEKLILSDKTRDHLIHQLLQQSGELRPDEMANWLSADLINRAQLNELNIKTCLDYFDWTDLTLEDLQKS